MEWITSLGVIALLAFASVAQKTEGKECAVFAKGQATRFEAMIEELSQADVVFVGENHDHALGHKLQVELLKAIHVQRPKITLSLEMFERDVQDTLDEYLKGQITEKHFLDAARPWPRYKTDYRPLVEYCRERGLPVVAANAPRRYVNIVSREGQSALRALSGRARSYLAPLPYPMQLPADYEKQLDALFGGAHGDSTAPTPGTPSADNMKQAQGLWDATMADSLANHLRRNAGRLIFQVNGAMHSDSGFGIVARLRVLMPRRNLKIVTIKPSKCFPQLPTDLAPSVADFVLITPSETSETPKK